MEVRAADFKTCPSCSDSVGAWREHCDCGWNFQTQRQEGVGHAPIKGNDNRADRSLGNFRQALEDYRQDEKPPIPPENDERIQFIRHLEERYPRRPMRAVIVWLCITAITIAVAGTLALTIVPLTWVGWTAFRTSRVRKQERRLTAYCARLRLAGEASLAGELEQLVPVVRHAPGIVDDVLAQLGIID